MLNYHLNIGRVITVIPTFFNTDQSLNLNYMFQHIEQQIVSGINTIVILGTTSEAPTLSKNERLFVAKNVWDSFNQRINIIVGLGGNNTMDMLDEIKFINNFSHYIMISQPSYNKPSQEGLFQHYKLLIEATDKPIIIYNIPSRTGVNIEPVTVQKISQVSPRVIAIKEASGNLEQVMQIKKITDLFVFSGDDALVLPILSIGGDGVISVVSNLVPAFMNNIVHTFLKESHKSINLDDLNGLDRYYMERIEKYDSFSIKASYEMFYDIIDLIKFCFIESNPVPVKFMISRLANEPNMSIVRLPLVELTQTSKDKSVLLL